MKRGKMVFMRTRKILLSLTFVLFSKFSFSESVVYELGKLWDSVESNKTLSAKSDYERYNEISEALKNGRPGTDDFSNEELKDKWISILEDFESYWTENCPRKFTFSKLRKYETNKTIKVPSTTETESDNPNYEEKTVQCTNYSVSINSDYILKYYEMREIIQTGLKKAKKPDWTEIPKGWPIDSINRSREGDFSNLVKGTAILSFSGNSPASLVRINGTTFLDLSFEIKDKSGHTLLSSERNLVGKSNVIFSDVEEDKINLIDKAIEEEKIEFVPLSLHLIYGSPQKISNDRDWIKDISEKQYSLSNIRFENSYKKIRPESNVINEAEARVLANELMVQVEGSGSIGSFEVAKTEVTQRLYKDVMGVNPSGFKGDKKPVENVSWNDALYFCNRLSEICGKTPVYKLDGESDTFEWNYIPHVGNRIFSEIELTNANGFRLPTEEEWIYVAKGGSSNEDTIYSGSSKIENVAWFKRNAVKTKDVATKKDNSLGIFDMTGNVWEWCFDVSDKDGYARIAHGGSWSYDQRYCKISDRYIRNPHQRFDCLGIRLVCGNSGSKPAVSGQSDFVQETNGKTLNTYENDDK